jgi:signal transduction histidine kinase
VNSVFDSSAPASARSASRASARSARIVATAARWIHDGRRLDMQRLTDQGMASSELLDLSAVAEDALDLAAPGITRLGLRVEADLSPAETTGDQQLIERMVWNLVDNAVRHNEPDPGDDRPVRAGRRPADRQLWGT